MITPIIIENKLLEFQGRIYGGVILKGYLSKCQNKKLKSAFTI